jgi:polyphosphate kinase
MNDITHVKEAEAKPTDGQTGFGPLHLSEQYTQNRELSWLRFNERVLMEGYDESVPLYERLGFASIFTSNLDEFFMIRMGGLHDLSLLKKPPIDNKSFETPQQQLDHVYEACVPLYEKRDELFSAIETKLWDFDVRRFTSATLSTHDRKDVDNWATREVLPLLSPQIIDPSHPFPHLENGAIYIAVRLKDKVAGDTKLVGLLPVPRVLQRTYRLSSDGLYYILIEDVIATLADQVFDMFTITEKCTVRVARNADIDPDDETWDDDLSYRGRMQKVLRKRTRLAAVRLEVQGEKGNTESKLVKFLTERLGLTSKQVFYTVTPTDLSYVYALTDAIPAGLRTSLLYRPFSPQESPDVNPDRPMADQIAEKDILLYYPYESMDPFLRLLRECASDTETISIKITLYRIATKSRLAESLITAAGNGKEVSVLMELRARFDEENNLEWAKRLEEAGCNVIYGMPNYKVHSKICLITRNSGGAIQRITQLGTGNYNEKTARLYTDYSLMTCDKVISEDANTFFRNLSIGSLEGDYSALKVAPLGLRPAVIDGIDREIAKAHAGEPSLLTFKMNSLTDRHIIDKLIEASCAGVEVNLIIRGICCLLPGIPGESENIKVMSIIGRLLEHARIYVFGIGDDPSMLLSSADMMTRNNERRIEIAYPILDPELKERILNMLELQSTDTVKGRTIDREGLLCRIPLEEGEKPFNFQEYFMRRAEDRAARARAEHGAAQAMAAHPGSLMLEARNAAQSTAKDVRVASTDNASTGDASTTALAMRGQTSHGSFSHWLAHLLRAWADRLG